ncbi:uncharacterized protein si:ch211-153l6.6 isoform X1 [Periophthalmus magnuspinnatus]|uniref:uncharacterized protein si:ch211-153l6.6 isoform X1 n=2 Tax=Periophthalmus magnuspinnatus TaxID=409849 RepID=UPI002436BBB4|nr:uncharacterized protein si:ch211-153l6.6 isoform X1 [Periophthalmus magnuspinnatus]
MRPSSRRRVPAWLLALPLGRRDCALRGRLEMISFWLLCWKLLRATTGLGRTAGELTDASYDADGSRDDEHHDNDNFSNGPPPSQEPVTMEISSSPPLLMDLERENLQNYKEDEEEEEELQYPEVQKVRQPISNVQEDNCDYLVFEISNKKVVEEDENSEDTADDFWTTEMETREEVKQEAETNNQSELLFESRAEDRVQSEPRFLRDSDNVWSQETGLRDDLSDCLQAELALVYSDSDAGDDQWAASLNGDVVSQTGKDAEGRKDSLTGHEEVPAGEERSEKPSQSCDHPERSDSREEMASRRDMFLRGSSTSSTTSSTDPDRKLSDLSMQQGPQSENVSTEHLDFLLARQQWKKMEEEVKGRPIPKPGLRAQGSFQGTHTSLYPPTRSPRLKHRDVQAATAVSREPPLSSALSSVLSPGSEDSGLDESWYRSPLEEPESAVEREIRLTLEREEKHRRERGLIQKGIALPRPSCLQTSRSPPRPPACRTPTLSVSPSFSPSCSTSVPRNYHELTASNVIILEPDTSPASRSRLISTATGALSDWPSSTANVVVVETSNLIIRSASEFCLNTAPVGPETQESTFTSNPFFKLRSLSSQSLVEQEIRLVRQREEEWRRQREDVFRGRKEKYHTVLVSPALTDNISSNVPEVADRCVSSPSSPSRARKMERSSLSCDHKFPSSLSSVPRRQNAMAQRWEASLLANQKKD